MKKITFKMQVIILFIIIGIGHLTAYFIRNGIAINISHIVCGLLFILNPVYPDPNGMIEYKKGVKGARIAGVIIIILAVLTKNGFVGRY